MDKCSEKCCCENNSKCIENLTKEELEEKIQNYGNMAEETQKVANGYREKVYELKREKKQLYVKELIKSGVRLEGLCLSYKTSYFDYSNFQVYVKIIKAGDIDLTNGTIFAQIVKIKIDLEQNDRVFIASENDFVSVEDIIEKQCSEATFNEAFVRVFQTMNEICSNNSKGLSYDRSASLIDRMNDLDKKR